MGSLLHKQIQPIQQSDSINTCTLLDSKIEVSRANFTFLHKIDSFGYMNECILWLACNKAHPKEKYFVRQISKYKIYNHKKITGTLNELHLLTHSNNPYLIKVYYAFQDYQYLYLVSEALESNSLEQVMKTHLFSEDDTRYIVMALISIIDYIHNEGYAITQLNPRSIHINNKNGHLKLIYISNPTPIDSFFSSNIVSEVCPYSAPEILFRDKVVAECDFYSLGLIVYQLMTQTKAIPFPEDKVYKRNDILKQTLQVQKCQVPQDWQPEVADFLIKLLIKNPNLRLGRYGSFEVKNHTWLKEFDLLDRQKKGIRFDEGQHCTKPNKIEVEFQSNSSNQHVKNIYFQELFQKYRYQLTVNEIISNKQQQQSIEISNERTEVYNLSNVNLRRDVL